MSSSMTDAEVWAKQFKEVCKTRIHREGVYELLDWLDTTDFFTAPAGLKHHGAYPGGLVRHSLNVYMELRDSYSEYLGDETAETLAICALFHDVCKIGVYHHGPDGYTFRDPLPLGHGEKSVFLLSRFIRLTEEEAVAIRWHMGPYDAAAKGGSRELDAAMAFAPIVYALHAADMRAALSEKGAEA